MKTTYSRRELYALGEPLGNSATYKKATGGLVLGGGGGGSQPSPAPAPQPTQTNVQNTNIPEYARPYVETMLGTTQQQIYNYDNSGNVTGIKPYVPYSENPADYIAGFSPMQQAAQQQTADLQVPGQYQQATQMTGAAGLGSLGLAGQEAQAGQQYNRMATNPYAVGAFMNPYLQQSLAPQQQLLNQQYGITGAQQQGQATSSGAFGGTRNAVMQGLNEQNRLLAQQQLLGQGYNQAYNQAQQAMQFGSQQGLAGQQAAMQGLGQVGQLGGQLANIGGQQLGAQQNIIATQSQAGAQQQQQQQNIINQAIQNYATAQQYPQQQLSFMNAMLRGLPTQQTTTNTYQATPSTLNQITGLGIAGLGAYNAFGK